MFFEKWENFTPRDYHPGQGIYRSSYKNACRLAVTETNMAYRTSDYLRWQQMEFVVGIRVVMSNNHTLNGAPFEDICDQLSSKKQGDGKGLYPKDFKFVGWHPHCRCHVETILKTDEEMESDTQRILDGEPTSTDSVNAVTDTPKEFKDWLSGNKERAKGWKSMPYVLRDNSKYIALTNGDTETEQLADFVRRDYNKHTANALAADNNYTDVQYDPKSGGMKATHIGHNFDPHTGHYERSVRDVAYMNGEKVILGNEPSNHYKQKSTEGTWNDRLMEIASAETATPKNIRSALKHCVSKPGAEVAVIYLPNGADLADIEQGLKLFNGLRNATGDQWRQFAEIVFISPEGIIKKLRP